MADFDEMRKELAKVKKTYVVYILITEYPCTKDYIQFHKHRHPFISVEFMCDFTGFARHQILLVIQYEIIA